MKVGQVWKRGKLHLTVVAVTKNARGQTVVAFEYYNTKKRKWVATAEIMEDWMVEHYERVK